MNVTLSLTYLKGGVIMRKITHFLSLLFVLSLCFVSVNAASGINAAERTVINNYKAGYSVGSVLIVPSAGDVTVVENLMNHDDVNLSVEDAASINKAIDDIYAILSSKGGVDGTGLSQSDRDTILNIATETAWPLGFTFTYDPSTDIASIWSNGGVIASTNVSIGSSVVKQTGYDVSIFAGLGILIALVSASYIALKKQND